MTRLPLFSLCFVIIIHLGDDIFISTVFDDDINHCYDSFDFIRYGVVVLSVSHHDIIVRSPTKRDITCLSWADGKHNSHKAAYSYQLKKTTDGVQNRSAIGPYFMT